MSFNLNKIIVNWEHWEKVAETRAHLETLSLPERERYLEALCISEPSLYESIMKLNAESKVVLSFLDKPALLEVAPGYALAHLDLRKGESFDRFTIEKELGRGGCGAVYLAKEKGLDRKVALKITDDSGQEGKLMAQLEHPRIVRVYSQDTQKSSGWRWVAMQWVPGRSLAELNVASLAGGNTGEIVLSILETQFEEDFRWTPAAVKHRALLQEMDEIEMALHVGISVAEALQFAHAQGIFHLDIKPGNILLNPAGEVFLADFGVAQNAPGPTHEENNVGGTYTFMAPEQRAWLQARASENPLPPPDEKADIYALGLVLIDLLGNAGLPDDLKSILDMASDSRPEKRFPSAEDLKKALVSFGQAYESRVREDSGAWTRLLALHPLWALTLFGAIPQIIASLVATAYNSLWILKRLTIDQQLAFDSINRWLSPISFFVAGTLWVFFCAKIYRAGRNRRHLLTHVEQGDRLRKQVLNLPWIGLGTSLASWGTSYAVLSGSVFSNAEYGSVAFFNWSLVFVLSFLISAAYTFLFHQFVIVGYVYPRLWIGEKLFKESARVDFKSLGNSLKVAVAASLIIPNLAALFLLLVSSEEMTQVAFQQFRFLTAGLVLFGVLGVVFSLYLGFRLAGLIASFTK